MARLERKNLYPDTLYRRVVGGHLLYAPVVTVRGGVTVYVSGLVSRDKQGNVIGKGDRFRDSMIEVGVLGVLVLVLSVAAILLRAKEREPQEGDPDSVGKSRRDGEALTPGQGDPRM